ncbi:MAG: AMP-binding protein [Alphaproteobacteria bacterium]|nr:AMP-binding protein [Alphaproteobacteria bacterium]
MTQSMMWRPEQERLSGQALTDHQLDLLRERLAYVSERSPFYRRKLKEAGIVPKDMQSLDDVRRIPFTVKDEMKDSQAAAPPWGDFHCISQDEAVRVFQTSGTTGRPVRIMLNRADWHENYYQQFMHYRCGYGLTEKDIAFFPFNYGLYVAWWGFQTAMERAGLMVLPGGGQSSKDRLRNILDWNATVVCGTPSYLQYLAEMAIKSGMPLAESPVKRIVVAGEPGGSIPATRKFLESAWGAECFDDVGSTEIGNFAFECQAHDGLHVIEGMYLAEVLDPETLMPVKDGEVGELILTNLCCESAPLIRYRTRDLVRASRKPCSCGRHSMRLEGGILGRSDDMFQFAGVNIFPSQIQGILHGIDEFSQEFQLLIPRQGSGKRLIIRVEPMSEQVPEADLIRARDYLIETVRYRITITPDIEIVEAGSLPRSEGKSKRVIRES